MGLLSTIAYAEPITRLKTKDGAKTSKVKLIRKEVMPQAIAKGVKATLLYVTHNEG